MTNVFVPFTKEHNFIHYPIRNMDISHDNNGIIQLCVEIILRIYNGEKIYIHCSGGHGRTGTIAAVILCILYNITPDNAFEYIQYSHDQRHTSYGRSIFSSLIGPFDYNNGVAIKTLFTLGQVPTPQTTVQRYQVRKIVELYNERPNKKLTDILHKNMKETSQRKEEEIPQIQNPTEEVEENTNEQSSAIFRNVNNLPHEIQYYNINPNNNPEKNNNEHWIGILRNVPNVQNVKGGSLQKNYYKKYIKYKHKYNNLQN